MSVRLDKWLQVARVFKTRTRATEACQLGRVRRNGARVKPHRPVSIGDRLEIELRDWTRILEVREIRDKPVKKADAAKLYDDLSGPRPELDPMERLMRRPVAPREAGSGRPTKRQGRKLSDLKKR